MAVVYALVVSAALLALLLPTCAIALMIFQDDRRGWTPHPPAPRGTRAARRAARRERRLLDRLDRTLGDVPGAGRQSLAALDQPGRPSIEALAADLRRLGRLRRGVARTSSVWYDAILMAYDERLRLACRYLGVVEHLELLGGVDREIERVRVEGELLGMGLALGSSSEWGQAA